MKWITAAEGPIQDYIHVLVDEIPYCVHHKRAEIHYEGKDPSALHILMTNDKHRRNLAERASLVHKECGGWTQQRKDSWNVHCGGKNVKVQWDGSMGGKKAAAAAERKASPEAQDMAMQMYGKALHELTPEEIQSLVDQLRSKTQPQTQQPSAPMSPALAPLAPGQASVRWTAAADENPFAKKDEKKDDSKGDDKDDEKSEDKSDKKAPPFGKKDDKSKDSKDDKKDEKPKEKKDSKPAPKKDAPKKEKKDSPEPKDPKEKGDIKDAEKAIDLIEKLLEKENAEGEPHAEELARCLDILKRFVGEEADELPMGDMPGMPDMPGAPKPPIKLDLKPVLPPAPMGPAVPLGPKPAWTDTNSTGFREADLVWRKADVDGPHGIGLEPGRVIAIGGGKVVVDWGDTDGIPAEERPQDLVLAERAEGENDLFRSDDGSTFPVEVEQSAEASREELRKEVESILANTSFKDILTKESSEGADDKKIVHLSTGSIGEVVAKASDGRILARFGGKEVFVWPYEVRLSNQEE